MTLNASTFRDAYPAFEDDEVYTVDAINFWGSVANLMLNPDRWGSMLALGTGLFIAHNLVLEKQAIESASRGGDPGLKVGSLTGTTVNGVSVSYDVAQGVYSGAGHYNKTTYGVRFYELIQMVGAGPIQVNGTWCPTPFSSGAWDGPPPWPGWFSS